MNYWIGIVPKLLVFAEQEDDLDLQLETLWLLTNMTSQNDEPEPIKKMMENGMAEVAISILTSTKKIHILEQVIWLISNIVGEPNLTFRKKLLDLNLVSHNCFDKK